MAHNRTDPHDPAGNQDERLALEPAPFVDALTPEERTLLVVRDELYEGSWERMAGDLRNRLTGKPYIFKLVNRIEADLASIAFLSTYERERSVDLGQFVRNTQERTEPSEHEE